MFRERKFTLSLPVLSTFFFAAVVVGVYGTRLPQAIAHPPAALLIALLVSATVGAVIRALFPTYLGPEGIRATDGVGRYHDVRWNSIRSVKTVCGFLWIRHGPPFTALTVPVFLDDGKGFCESVLIHAPLDNPLRVYFERR